MSRKPDLHIRKNEKCNKIDMKFLQKSEKDFLRLEADLQLINDCDVLFHICNSPNICKGCVLKVYSQAHPHIMRTAKKATSANKFPSINQR